MSKKGNAAIGLVIVLLIIGIGITYWKKSKTQSIPPSTKSIQIEPPDKSISPIPENQNKLESSESRGIIKGKVNYPSEIVPQDMSVCAEEIKTKAGHCNDIKGQTYELSVPPGTYHVFAFLSEPEKYGLPKDHRAFYSEFVTCGQKTTCTSHTPIPVTISAGQTLVNINPQDW